MIVGVINIYHPGRSAFALGPDVPALSTPQPLRSDILGPVAGGHHIVEMGGGGASRERVLRPARDWPARTGASTAPRSGRRHLVHDLDRLGLRSPDARLRRLLPGPIRLVRFAVEAEHIEDHGLGAAVGAAVVVEADPLEPRRLAIGFQVRRLGLDEVLASERSVACGRIAVWQARGVDLAFEVRLDPPVLHRRMVVGWNLEVEPLIWRSNVSLARWRRRWFSKNQNW